MAPQQQPLDSKENVNELLDAPASRSESESDKNGARVQFSELNELEMPITRHDGSATRPCSIQQNIRLPFFHHTRSGTIVKIMVQGEAVMPETSFSDVVAESHVNDTHSEGTTEPQKTIDVPTDEKVKRDVAHVSFDGDFPMLSGAESRKRGREVASQVESLPLQDEELVADRSTTMSTCGNTITSVVTAVFNGVASPAPGAEARIEGAITPDEEEIGDNFDMEESPDLSLSLPATGTIEHSPMVEIDTPLTSNMDGLWKEHKISQEEDQGSSDELDTNAHQQCRLLSDNDISVGVVSSPVTAEFVPPNEGNSNTDSIKPNDDPRGDASTAFPSNDENRGTMLATKVQATSTGSDLSASDEIQDKQNVSEQSQGELVVSLKDPARTNEEPARKAKQALSQGEPTSSNTKQAAPLTASSEQRAKDHTTNRYKVNGVIRRPCVCANSEECREMMVFWCEAVDDELNPRDPCRAGYFRLPMYTPNAKTAVQHYKNRLRLSFLGHVRPDSAEFLANSRRQGKNTADYVALHHFPREFLKKVGKGLKIEFLDESMAQNYELLKDDKITVDGHPLCNKYFAPPCYKWSDLLDEYGKAVAMAGTSVGRQVGRATAATKVLAARSTRPKILCLGMSKACVESQIDSEGYAWNILDDTSPSVAQAVELVRRGILTEMDGRDLARCRAMEERHKVDAYTVSQELGSQYDDSFHLHANFNRSNFCHGLEKAFNKPMFRQIALDYFWIPSGSWSQNHWGKSFFRITLPNFVKRGMLEFPPESQYGAKPSGSSRKLGYGVVYLPFCLHCVKQLIAALDEIKQYYKITFLYKSELEEHALWSGTSTIDAKIMQGRFGKNIAQEEIYCTFAPRDVYEASEDEHITTDNVVNVLRGIEDFERVRMIRLTPLAKHNPRFKRIKRFSDEVGGFVDLLDPKDVQRGFDSLLPASKQITESSSEEEEFEEEEESSSEEELSTPPPIRKKAVVQRKRQSKSKQAAALTPTLAPTRPKKRMFEVLPDLETYCSIGLPGNEKVADYYALPERKLRRKRCDISTYHFGPEPKSPADKPPADEVGNEVTRRPSLLSKLTLSFVSCYDEEQFQRRRAGLDEATREQPNKSLTCAVGQVESASVQDDTLLSKLTLSFMSGYDNKKFRRRRHRRAGLAEATREQQTTTLASPIDQAECTSVQESSDFTNRYLMMLASATEATGQDSTVGRSDCSDSSTSSLMMLASTSEPLRMQRLANDCKKFPADKSYASILASTTNAAYCSYDDDKMFEQQCSND